MGVTDGSETPAALVDGYVSTPQAEFRLPLARRLRLPRSHWLPAIGVCPEKFSSCRPQR